MTHVGPGGMGQEGDVIQDLMLNISMVKGSGRHSDPKSTCRLVTPGHGGEWNANICLGYLSDDSFDHGEHVENM